MECGTFPTSPGQIEASAMCDVSWWMRFNVLHFHLPLDMCVFAVLNLPYQHPIGDRAAPSPAVHQGLHGHGFPFMGKNHTGCPLRAGMQMLKGLEHFLLWGHPDCPPEIWPQCQELPGGFFALYCLQQNEQMVAQARCLLSHLCTFSTNSRCLCFPLAPWLMLLPCQRFGVSEQHNAVFLLT